MKGNLFFFLCIENHDTKHDISKNLPDLPILQALASQLQEGEHHLGATPTTDQWCPAQLPSGNGPTLHVEYRQGDLCDAI